jgi:hypothetical protein
MRMIVNIMIAVCLATIGVILGPQLVGMLNHPADAVGLCPRPASTSDLIAELHLVSRVHEVPLERSPWADTTASRLGDDSHALAVERWQERLDRARAINAAHRNAPTPPRIAGRTSARPKFRRSPVTTQPESIFERSRHYEKHGSVYERRKHRRSYGGTLRRSRRP